MPELLAIVAVDFSDRVRCQQPVCRHAVYRRIQVVRDDDELSAAERQLLVDNADALLTQFERER